MLSFTPDTGDNSLKISNKTLILIISCVVLVIAGLCLLVYTMDSGGTQVKVTVGGEVYGTYDLHSDQTVRIEGDGWYNVLNIQNGRAAITESDCSNQICVHTPALTEDVTGLIVCLPHGVVVELAEG